MSIATKILPLFQAEPRLGRQQEAVMALMRDGTWRTLKQISEAISGCPEASASARLRHCRKLGHTVDRRRVGDGLYEYRVRGGTT